jgi:hypothetical protein
MAVATGGCDGCRLRVARTVLVSGALRSVGGEPHVPLSDIVRALEGRLDVDREGPVYRIHAGICRWCVLEVAGRSPPRGDNSHGDAITSGGNAFWPRLVRHQHCRLPAIPVDGEGQDDAAAHPDAWQRDVASEVNEAGTVVGSSLIENCGQPAILRIGGSGHDTGSRTDGAWRATGTNRLGHVVGQSSTPPACTSSSGAPPRSVPRAIHGSLGTNQCHDSRRSRLSEQGEFLAVALPSTEVTCS